MLYKNLLLISLFLLITFSCFPQSQNIWKTSSPEEQGMNSLIFANAIKQAKQNGTNIHSLLIIKNNHIILDASFYPFKNTYVHDLASVTKSITSLLIGIAIDKKFIKSENELIINYFPVNELNKKFLLDNNKMGLQSMHFEKRKTGYYIILNFNDSSKEAHPIGMNNQYKISNEHTFGLPMAIKGKWLNNTLYIDYNRLCRIEDYKFAIIFKENNLIELKLTEASKGINQTITGKAL